MEPEAGADASPGAERLELPDADPGDGHQVMPGLEPGDDAGGEVGSAQRSAPETGGPDTQLSPTKD